MSNSQDAFIFKSPEKFLCLVLAYLLLKADYPPRRPLLTDVAFFLLSSLPTFYPFALPVAWSVTSNITNTISLTVYKFN